MAKYRKKPVVIEAITFNELVKHGKNNGANIVNGMPWSFTYNGHPVTHENDECYLIPTLEGTLRFTPEDMLITGTKGEIYPCKIDIFEGIYNDSSKMTFGDAIETLKAGKRVARAGWNGKRMYLGLCEGGGFRDGYRTQDFIYMKTADDKIVPWLASQTDVLAEDWTVVE